jgi:hypothetical protein
LVLQTLLQLEPKFENLLHGVLGQKGVPKELPEVHPWVIDRLDVRVDRIDDGQMVRLTLVGYLHLGLANLVAIGLVKKKFKKVKNNRQVAMGQGQPITRVYILQSRLAGQNLNQ